MKGRAARPTYLVKDAVPRVNFPPNESIICDKMSPDVNQRPCQLHLYQAGKQKSEKSPFCSAAAAIVALIALSDSVFGYFAARADKRGEQGDSAFALRVIRSKKVENVLRKSGQEEESVKWANPNLSVTVEETQVKHINSVLKFFFFFQEWVLTMKLVVYKLQEF